MRKSYVARFACRSEREEIGWFTYVWYFHWAKLHFTTQKICAWRLANKECGAVLMVDSRAVSCRVTDTLCKYTFCVRTNIIIWTFQMCQIQWKLIEFNCISIPQSCILHPSRVYSLEKQNLIWGKIYTWLTTLQQITIQTIHLSISVCDGHVYRTVCLW